MKKISSDTKRLAVAAAALALIIGLLTLIILSAATPDKSKTESNRQITLRI